MDFYDVVTAENAQAWYEALPAHLKKTLDAQLEALTKADVHAKGQKLDKRTEEDVSKLIGYSLPDHVQVNRGPEGNMPDEIERFERRHAWCKLYNEHSTLQVILREAPRMQKERKMLSQALGLKQGGNGLPSQAEGLDDTQAATIRWLQSSGETPLEYLTSVYRNTDNEVKTSDKIAAARALLDYVHRKVPQKQEIETTNGAPKIEPSLLRSLSAKELDILENLIKKMDKS